MSVKHLTECYINVLRHQLSLARQHNDKVREKAIFKDLIKQYSILNDIIYEETNKILQLPKQPS